MLNDSPVGCQTRAVTEPQRDGGICEANAGEVFKTATFKPLSRARKERAPGIPRGMMRGKPAGSLRNDASVFKLEMVLLFDGWGAVGCEVFAGRNLAPSSRSRAAREGQ